MPSQREEHSHSISRCSALECSPLRAESRRNRVKFDSRTRWIEELLHAKAGAAEVFADVFPDAKVRGAAGRPWAGGGLLDVPAQPSFKVVVV